MGRGQPKLCGNNLQNVLACSCQRAERGQMNHLPGPLAEYASAEPRGGHTHHSAGGLRNIQGRTAGVLPGGL